MRGHGESAGGKNKHGRKKNGRYESVEAKNLRTVKTESKDETKEI